MEKNYNFIVDGGGVFSRLLQGAIIPLSDIEFDNVYLIAKPVWVGELLNTFDPRSSIEYTDQYFELSDYVNEDPFERLLNYILDQKTDSTYKHGGMLPLGKVYTRVDKIENSSRLKDYRRVISKIRFKKSTYIDAQRIFNGLQKNKVLGVHLRLKDVYEHGHDNAGLGDFTRAIDAALKNYNYEKIFVASDSVPGIDVLKSLYGSDMILHHNHARSSVLDSDGGAWEWRNLFKKKYWDHAVVDCFSLAYCRSLVCRVSNFSNAAIVFGNHEEIISV